MTTGQKYDSRLRSGKRRFDVIKVHRSGSRNTTTHALCPAFFVRTESSGISRKSGRLLWIGSDSAAA